MADSRFETAFPHLPADLIEAIEAHAEVLDKADGEFLWHVGEANVGCYIVKEGRVEIVEESSSGHTHVAFHDAGAFSGDVDVLSGRPSVVAAIVRGPSKVIRLSPEC